MTRLGGAGLAIRTAGAAPETLGDWLGRVSVSPSRRGNCRTGREGRGDERPVGLPGRPVAHLDPDERLIVGRDPVDEVRDKRPPPAGVRLDLGGAVKRVCGAAFLDPADRPRLCAPALLARFEVERDCLEGGRRADLGELLAVRRPPDRWVPAEWLTRDGARWVLRGDDRLADRLERLEGGPARALAATSPRAATQATNARPRTARHLMSMPISSSDVPPPARIPIGVQVIAARQ